MEKEPVLVNLKDDVVKIISGGDHLVMLTRDGDIYTMGNSEQGQLGRVPEMFAHRGGRRGGQLLLAPEKIHPKTKSKVFKDVWAGSYNTVALNEEGEVRIVLFIDQLHYGIIVRISLFIGDFHPKLKISLF